MRLNSLELIQESLFDSNRKKELTPKQQEQLTRYQSAFVMWLDKPLMKDSEIRDYLVNNFEISNRQAYYDIKNLKYLIGNVKEGSKEYYRHLANEILQDARTEIDNAKDKFELEKAKAKVKVARAMVDVNRLNQNDPEPMPWDELMPQSFEPTTDPTTIGLKDMPRKELKAKIKKMEEQYAGEIDIQDIEYEEIPE